MRANWRLIAGICCIVGCARGATVEELDPVSEEMVSPSPSERDAGGTPTTDPAVDAGNDGSNDALPPDRERPDDDPPTAPGPACPSVISCEQAKMQGIPNLGSVEWADVAPIATRREAGSRFYLVGVTGDNANEVVRGGIEARLTSHLGSNYDLYLYGGAEGYNNGRDTCEGPGASSENAEGAEDVASMVWAAAAFGVLSDRLVTVEVRHVAGPCAEFTLELRGAKQ